MWDYLARSPARSIKTAFWYYVLSKCPFPYLLILSMVFFGNKNESVLSRLE